MSKADPPQADSPYTPGKTGDAEAEGEPPPPAAGLADAAGYASTLPLALAAATFLLQGPHASAATYFVFATSIALATALGTYALRKMHKRGRAQEFAMLSVGVGVLVVATALYGLVSDFDRIAQIWSSYLSR